MGRIRDCPTLEARHATWLLHRRAAIDHADMLRDFYMYYFKMFAPSEYLVISY